jgi:hypothetical protein
MSALPLSIDDEVLLMSDFLPIQCAPANRRYAGQFGSVGFYHATRAGGRFPSAAVAELGR